MPKKVTQKDKQAALRQKHATAPFPVPGESDPPIIVSGGSVTITSKFELTPSRDAKGNYVYKTDKVKVKKIKTKGKKSEEDEPKSDGTFEIELFG